MKKGINVIKLNLFPYDIAVANCVSVDEIKKKMATFGQDIDKNGEDFLRSSGLAHTMKMPNRAVLIYFPKEPTQGIIAHEVFHAVWMILATMGVEPSVESEEVYAYMIEYIVNKITPRL
jgi:hypothetical protein